MFHSVQQRIQSRFQMAHQSPKYYTRGSIEVWDFIRDQRLNYHLGNAVKYICRAGYKDDPIKDLDKAIHYLTNERDELRKQHEAISQSIPAAHESDAWLFESSTDFDR